MGERVNVTHVALLHDIKNNKCEAKYYSNKYRTQ